MPSCPVTKTLLAAAVVTTGLVQSQRLAPSAICFPSSLEVALEQPWRLVTAFLYADGFSLSFVLQLHLIACLSRQLEFAFAGPHVTPCPLYIASAIAERSAPDGVLARLAAPVQYAAALLGGMLLIALSTVARPTDLGQPFLMTPLLFYLAYLASRLAPASGFAIGGVGVPYALWLPYGLLLFLAAVSGAGAAISAIGGVGGGLFMEILDVLPLSEALAAAAPVASPTYDTFAGAKAAAIADKKAEKKAEAAAKEATDAKDASADPPQAAAPKSRRTGMTMLLLCLGGALRLGGVVPEAPPMAAHSLLYATQAKQLLNATMLQLDAPPVVAFFAELSMSAGINASRH